jgi:CO dehydrogenase maturation factor
MVGRSTRPATGLATVTRVKLAVVGKGGAGKSVIAGTMARLIARGGTRVLALDSDLLPGLSISLGSGPEPAEPPLNDAVEKDENGRWRLKKGVGPVRAVQRYAIEAPDGVRMLQMGKTPRDGVASIMGSINAFYRVVHRLPGARAFNDWTFIGDLPAGPRQAAYNWAPYAEKYVVVVQPGAQSALTARRVARILRQRGGADIVLVANRVRSQRDIRHVEKLIGEPVFTSLPFDDRVATAERLGIAPIEYAPGSPAVLAIERLAAALSDG